MLRVWRGEGCSVIYELVASFEAEKRKVNVGDAWFRVLPAPLSLSLSLSLSISLSLSLSLSVLSLLVSSAFFCSAPLSRNLSFISFFSSDRIRLGFLCFLPRSSRIGRKITFNHFYFWQISSTCADPVNAPLDARCNHYFACTIN